MTGTYILSPNGKCAVSSDEKYKTSTDSVWSKGTVTQIWYIDFQKKLKYFQVFIHHYCVNNTKFNFQLVSTKHLFNEGLQGYRIQLSYTS